MNILSDLKHACLSLRLDARLILFIFYCVLWSVLVSLPGAHAAPQRWRATWWSDPMTTIALGWEQPEGGEALLEYRERPLKFISKGRSERSRRDIEEHAVTGEIPTHVVSVQTPHEGDAYWVQLTHLKPGVAYSFRVGTRATSDTPVGMVDARGFRWSERLWFKTIARDPKRLTVIAGGDSRNHREVRRAANRAVAELSPDFVLFGGDFTARDNTNQWDEWFDDWSLTLGVERRMIPLIPARGNHDSEEMMRRAWGRAHPHFYYSLTFGRDLLRVYTLNSERPAGGAQLEWLKRELHHNRDVKLRWAQYHKPMRPHTRRKSEGADEYQHWSKLFAESLLDLAIECDSHLMKVTWPVMPSASGSEGFKRVRRGTTYIGEGGWGAPLRSVNDLKPWTMATGRMSHFFWLEVESSGVYHITPMRIFSKSERVQIPGAPWQRQASIPDELRRLSSAAPLTLARDESLDSSGSSERPYEPIRYLPSSLKQVGYNPLHLIPLWVPGHNAP